MRERVTAALQDAMQSKDPTRLATLRLIQCAINDRDIAARARAGDRSDSGDGPIGADDAEIVDLLAKMLRQREESVRVYEEAGRLEVADRERAEMAIIQEFMPKPLSEDEVDRVVAEAIDTAGASDLRDLGRVMQMLKAAYAGRMDFGRAGLRVKQALS